MTNPLSTNQSNAQGSFGAMLQQARKNKQVSLEEAAGELFILKRHLQALESESFSELPQAAFARGFAINYAKFLGLDPAKVASSFDSVYPNELKPRSMNNTESLLRPMGTLQRDNRSRIRFNPLLVIAAIALVVLAVFLFRMVTNASKDEQPLTPVAEEVTASEQTQGAALNSVDNSVGASGSALNLGAADTENASLQLKLTDAASVGVIDATGTSLISGEQIEGDYQLSGQPPFNIVIDNIDNVDLSLNQQPVALEQYATGKKASFALTP
ncbi:helix-turn-helix domain-containing protein [Psychrobacter sp. TAE2020]|uniref:helix-turn-helix domain-containing protein n=1 Tax=Psychrobacter sp. TAE2020 TaxID=2846762 RepID=UPI001E5176E2|nr:helix-turn-helix domain-containing protein [Psychrobacter sp. TAE2020]